MLSTYKGGRQLYLASTLRILNGHDYSAARSTRDRILVLLQHISFCISKHLQHNCLFNPTDIFTMISARVPPPVSHLQELLTSANVASASLPQPANLHELATTVLYNLQHQQDWSDLCIHNVSPVTGEPLSRPLISGLPDRKSVV